jgi:hypothetical protein
MLSNALEIGVCFHRAPVLGNRGGHSFPRVFERRVKFLFIRRTFIEVFERQVKEDWRATLSIGAPAGEPAVVSFTGILRDR